MIIREVDTGNLYNSGMDMRMDLSPWVAPVARSKSNTRVLDEFPGFDEFYEKSIKPTIKKNPHKNITFVIIGEAGIGKETLEAMQVEKMEHDAELLEWQEEQGIESECYSSEWSDCLNFASTVVACGYDGKEGPIINSRKTNGDLKENHEYSVGGYDRASRFWQRNLLYRRRTLKPQSRIFVESVALIPDSLALGLRGIDTREQINIGFSAIRALARLPNTFFIGVVTDDKVQGRAIQFRRELVTATPENIPRLLKKYHLKVDKDIADDIEGFRRRMGTAEAITIIRDLVDREIFRLTQSSNPKIREAILAPMQYSLPRSLEDLKEIFDSTNYLGRRSRVLNFYLHYLFKTILRLTPDRYLIGENKFLNERIHLYRKSLETRTLPLYWPRRWGRI